MPKLPLSEKRLAANRANARKSTGPRSPEGKRRASRNNTRHGLYSAEVHLPDYWELRAIDTAQRAAAGYLRDPGLAAAVAARTYLRAHRSYATALVDRYYVERFSSADPHAYGRQNNNWFLAAIRYADHIRRQIRALDRFITPALLSYENETALAMTVGQAARPAAGLQTGQQNYNDSNPPLSQAAGALLAETTATVRTHSATARAPRRDDALQNCNDSNPLPTRGEPSAPFCDPERLGCRSLGGDGGERAASPQTQPPPAPMDNPSSHPKKSPAAPLKIPNQPPSPSPQAQLLRPRPPPLTQLKQNN